MISPTTALIVNTVIVSDHTYPDNSYLLVTGDGQAGLSPH